MVEDAEESVDVSVIVAVRNGGETLKQCIDSVLAQRGCTVELVIVDALSDDSTREIVESYGAAIATSIREADRGIYDAWNKGLISARGQWCAFLGADDYFLNERSVSTLLLCARESHQTPVFVFGGVLRTGGAEDYIMHPDPLDARAYLRAGKMLPPPGSLHHIGALRTIGGFDASFRIAGDFDAVLKLSRMGLVQRCGGLVSVMRKGGVSSREEFRRLRIREAGYALGTHFGKAAEIMFLVRKLAGQALVSCVEGAVIHLVGREKGNAALVDVRRRLGRQPDLLSRSQGNRFVG